MNTKTWINVGAMLVLCSNAAMSAPLGTTFTYQGRLTDGASLANGNYEFTFTLFNQPSGGSPVGGPLTNSPVLVSNGLFVTLLDFGGGGFGGDARWLEVGVRKTGEGRFTTLAARQPVTAVPYALYAPQAGTATSALSVSAGAVTSLGLADGAVTGAKIVDGTIADQDVDGGSGISASKIIGGDLRAERLKVGASHTLSGAFATIAGGSNHTATAQYASVGGGYRNSATGHASHIGGGAANTTSAADATVGGGENNTVGGPAATVSGGLANLATAPGAFVGGGGWNGASAGGNASTGICAMVAGGFKNVAGDAFATVAGGTLNLAGGANAAVGGGESNIANGDAASVSGGRNNVAGSAEASVGGGTHNTASGAASTVGGGAYNQATGYSSVVAGGGLYDFFTGPQGNLASGLVSAVVGGARNKATAEASFVGGGHGNVATNSFAVAVGGIQSEARGYASFVGGGGAWGAGGSYIFDGNVASGVSSVVVGGYGNLAANLFATIPGGRYNLADGAYSFAAGCRAKAHGNGSFVWGDANDFDVHAWGPNEFVVRATGGYWLFSAVDGSGNPTAGVTLAAGSGSWSSWSDRNAKTNCAAVDPRAVLDQVAALPIASWNYLTQDSSIRHLGPMAQDFHAAFGLGDSDKTITAVDADGVALAAIQGLNLKLEAENAALRQELAELKAALRTLARKVNGGEQ